MQIHPTDVLLRKKPNEFSWFVLIILFLNNLKSVNLVVRVIGRNDHSCHN